MNIDRFVQQLPDTDPTETQEWLDSLDQLIAIEGKTRARYLLSRMLLRAREQQVGIPATINTPYVNTIPAEEQAWFPGDDVLEKRIRRFIRWNAAVMVVRANHAAEGIGGHLSTFASSAALYEVGFNHFFRGKDDGSSGDQIFFQGHAAPGIYARAFLERRLTEDQLDHFRLEVAGQGISSYPHPRLMPNFWEYPTVSMGLGPLNSVYLARFNRYLHNRHIDDTSQSRVWAFLGDGEMDEPEALAGVGIAAREGLDNLTWVINANLQRLDGPVRGNGKIIQELEAMLRGAGWNVIKVIWGSGWDGLLARDVDGVLVNKMNSTLDGEYQKYAVESGEYIRENFFGPDLRLRKLVEHLSDDQLRKLPRGGHDYHKIYAAYRAAVEHEGRPTAIIAKTIKGWTLGPSVEARNATHQIKKLTGRELIGLRDRLHLQEEIPDEMLTEDREPPYYRPDVGTPEYEYLMERRKTLGGSVPKRSVRIRRPIELPGPDPFSEFDAGSSAQEFSTTMAFTRLLRNLARHETFGPRVVPIIPDEGRTFGMDSLFKELKIYAPHGQRYVPVDAGLLLSYEEATDGQILEEGITEAGAIASWTAAATAYAHRGVPMVPFYTFYSMFGFQRIGDFMWAAADARARGFLMGATAGRTTLLGEGLQHQDGHSLLLASTIPSCEAYDPAFAYELATIIQRGIERMYGSDGEDVFYYITIYNENYTQPPKPADVDQGIIDGLYRWAPAPEGPSLQATLLFSGTAHAAAREARHQLAEHYDVGVELWSATSYKRLREESLSTERWNRLHPGAEPRVPLVTRLLNGAAGPIVAVTDFLKAVPDQIARWVPRRFIPLGTDGYGRSDTREALRHFFETDTGHVVVAVLSSLEAEGAVPAEVVADAIARYEIDPDLPDPRISWPDVSEE
ncbi:MAG: pyruvate dehydrogenase (acetyl-transferring), homodimeric type [Actinobacteria bacterium]|nr:pyruvate dehydrogenase (acetyl-transferring), homodimeric type [Actinomycetota bacterium]